MNILKTIGNTPLLKIENIYAKLETTNPTGSVKDRMAAYIINQAEKRGELKKDMKIIEITSGNTGIALAMISAIKGYKFTAIMPESMSIERQKMIRAFGAKIVLTPAKDDMTGAIKKYIEMISENPNAWLPNQFKNQDNITAHEKGLGKEIIEQTNGKIDAFVAGAGTGGTLIGVARAFKRAKIKAKIIAVEPAESAVLLGGNQGLHKIQGIGEGFIPQILEENLDLIDEIIKISSKEAIKTSHYLTRKYGILVGISSGANFAAASKLHKQYKNVVTILPDRGERYLSMGE